MKKFLIFSLSILVFFLSSCGNRIEERERRTDFYSGTFNNGIYKNECFGVGFYVPDYFGAKKGDWSQNSLIESEDWYFCEKGTSASVFIVEHYIDKKQLTDEDGFLYVRNMLDNIYEGKLKEKKICTINIDNTEKDVNVVHLDDGEFEAYVGIFEKVVYVEEESWLMWMSFLNTDEEKLLEMMEMLTYDLDNMEEISGNQSDGEKEIVPRCGKIEGDYFSNEAFGIGIDVPNGFEYFAPEIFPDLKLEEFCDWSFGNHNIIIKILHFYYPVIVDANGFLEFIIDNSKEGMESSCISSIKIDEKEQICLNAVSFEGIYSVHIPKITYSGDGTWVNLVMIMAKEEKDIYDFVDRITFEYTGEGRNEN